MTELVYKKSLEKEIQWQATSWTENVTESIEFD